MAVFKLKLSFELGRKWAKRGYVDKNGNLVLKFLVCRATDTTIGKIKYFLSLKGQGN